MKMETEMEDFDLYDLLVEHPQSTYVLRVTGARMDEADVQEGDMLIVDTSLRPNTGDTVIVGDEADGFTVCLYRPRRGALRLVGSDDDHRQMPEGDVFGVVTFNVRRTRRDAHERQGAA
jgi:DNA polymerase V